MNEAEKKSVLLILKTFLQGRKEGSTGRISIEQYNREIDEDTAQIAAGVYITQADSCMLFAQDSITLQNANCHYKKRYSFLLL